MVTGRPPVVVGSHTVSVERTEPLRWRVWLDGQRLATYCSERRARAAGRLEARRLDLSRPERGVRRPGPR